jgi:glycosyltransferase involved in cell wall biosynthesis
LQAEQVPVTPHHYFLWIGNPLQARKNVGLLFAAFAAHQRSHPEHRYVLVVPASVREGLRARPEVARLGAALTLLSGVQPRVRDALYRCAGALVFPSTCEGFGYPVLEAMAQGCPPIAAAAGPAAEIVGDALTLCPDFQPESFTRRMRALIELPAGERTALAAALSRRAQDFSVRRMAASTIEVLLRAAAD